MIIIYKELKKFFFCALIKEKYSIHSYYIIDNKYFNQKE